jgi:uncharacterized protein
MIEILGFVGALLIGVSLGLIGGGGSILAVPILAYIFGVNEQYATAYSLFIVGVSALVGGIKQNKKGLVDWKTAVVFGIPTIIAVTSVRKFLIPALPDVLFQINDFEFTRRMAMFGLFAVLMIPSGITMIKGRKEVSLSENKKKFNYPLILTEGLLVGTLTGFVGAGGGFLIIPSLVILAKIEMKVAVATSLIIIAGNSILGFSLGDAMTLDINWTFLMSFTALSLVGIFVGTYLNNYIDGKKLKKGFGYFIFMMSAFIFYMEFFVKQ